MSQFQYTNDHECVHVAGDIAWVGISTYAQDALGDLVFVDLPQSGKTVSVKDSFAVVESVKTASDIYSPVDGEIVEVNTAMADDLELIKSPVNEKGWIAKIKITNPAQLKDLMDEGAYKKYLESIA